MRVRVRVRVGVRVRAKVRVRVRVRNRVRVRVRVKVRALPCTDPARFTERASCVVCAISQQTYAEWLTSIDVTHGGNGGDGRG